MDRSIYGSINDRYPISQILENPAFGLSDPEDFFVPFVDIKESGYNMSPEITVSEAAGESLIMETYQQEEGFWLKVLSRVIAAEILNSGYSYVKKAEMLCNLINYFIAHPDTNLVQDSDFALFAEQLLQIDTFIIGFVYISQSTYTSTCLPLMLFFLIFTVLYLLVYRHDFMCKEFYTASQTILKWSLKFFTFFTLEQGRYSNGLNPICTVFSPKKFVNANFYTNYSAYTKGFPYEIFGLLENLAYFVQECDWFTKVAKKVSDPKNSADAQKYIKFSLSLLNAYGKYLKRGMSEDFYKETLVALQKASIDRLSSGCSEDVLKDALKYAKPPSGPNDTEAMLYLDKCKELFDVDKLCSKMNAVSIISKVVSLIKPGDEEGKKYEHLPGCFNLCFICFQFFLKVYERVAAGKSHIRKALLRGVPRVASFKG